MKKRLNPESKRLRFKRTGLFFLVFVLLTTLVYLPDSMTTKVEAGDTSNITVANNGFETLNGSNFANWSIYSGTWGSQISRSSTKVLADSYSLKIYDTSASAGYGLRSDKYAANAYATYSATVTAYAASGGGQLYLEFWDGSNNRIGTQIASVQATGKWVLLRAAGQAPAGTRYVTILCYSFGTNTGTCYYDTAKIVRVDEVSGFTNAGFEGGTTNDVPNEWKIFGGVMGVNLFNATDVVHSGTNSFKIVDASGTVGYGIRTEPISAASGLKYEASSWLYNVTGNAQIYLEFWSSTVNNASDTRIGTVVISSNTTGQWQKISGTGTAPEGTEYMTVLLYTPQTGIITAYFDDITARQYYDAPSTSFTAQVTGHPRLYFTSSEIPALQAKTTDNSANPYGETFETTWSKVLNQADTYVDETVLVDNLPEYSTTVSFSLSPLTMPDPVENPTGFTGRYPYWTFLGYSVLTRIETLSYVYCITGDTTYAAKAKQLLLDLCSWPTWSDDTTDLTILTSLDAGYFTRGAALGYDMLYNYMSVQERATVFDAIYRNGIRPLYKETTYDDNNIISARSTGLGMAAIACLGEADFYDSYLGKAYDIWMWYLDQRDTGVNCEGFNYTNVVVSPIAVCGDYLKRVTGNTDIFCHNYFENKLSNWLAGFIAPEANGLPNFSDSSISNYLGTAEFVLANKINDDLAGWYIKFTDFGTGTIQRFNYLESDGLLTDPVTAGLPKADSSNAYIGYAAMRTGWGDDDNMLAMYSGPSQANHNHMDDNSFVYNVAGEWLLSDPGYQSFTPTAENFFTRQTIGHNSLLVNGNGQSVYSGGSILGSFDSDALKFIGGDATGSYSTTPDVTAFKRRFYGIDPDYTLVVDYVTLASSGTPEILFHGDGDSTFTNTSGTPLTIGNTLPSNFIIQKAKSSVAVQSLRPSNATRLYTQYTGAERFGTWGSIKTVSTVTAESFITLLRPKTDKTGIIEAEEIRTTYTSGGNEPYETMDITGCNVVYYDGSGAGDYVTYTFNVPVSGIYTLDVGLEKNKYGGILTAKLDGATLQSGIDTYGNLDALPLSYPNKTLSAGSHTVRFDITGKNAGSFGYRVDFDNLRVYSGTIARAQAYTVTTATNGTTTGLSIAIDASTTDQQLLNPSKGTGYTAGSLTISSKATQGMFRKTSGGAYLRYGQVDTLTTGATLLDGSQTLVQDLGASSAIGMMYDNGNGKWFGTLRLSATAAPKLYMPSVTSVKVDGTTLNGSQYSYSATAHLLTINSVTSGDHTLEIAP